MSRLEKMIQELCPNGVEFASIGSLITRIRERGKDDTSVSQVYVVSNTQGMVKAEDYRETTIHSEDTSNYTVVRRNMVAYNPSRLNIGSIAMLKDDVPGLVSPMYVVFSVDVSKINCNYFEYLMKSSYVASKINSLKEEGARFRFDFSRWGWITVPVPPIPVQEEIVRILDSFTSLTTELQAELNVRKKQYQHYLDSYFGFTLGEMEKRSKEKNIPIKPLSNLGSITRGKRFVHADAVDIGIPCIHYGELYTYYGISTYKTRSHVREELRSKLRYAQKNDVVIVGAGENNIDIGVGVAYLGDEPIAIHDACYFLKHNINPKYISYYLRTRVYHNQIKKYVSSGKICAISAEGIGRALIPVPPIEEQNRLVSFLDRFDTLCNDLSSGLPAEIAARQKQYEYYRDKLLTFKEAK